MPKAFDISNPPFDRLTPHEGETLRASLDIVYFSPGETIIGSDAPADALYVVIKGTVEERSEAALLPRLAVVGLWLPVLHSAVDYPLRTLAIGALVALLLAVTTRTESKPATRAH